MAGAPLPKVFICYANRDVATARDIFDELVAAGADPWLDKHRLVPGDHWEEEIELSRYELLRECGLGEQRNGYWYQRLEESFSR